MVVLGISGRASDAAAAVAVDGAPLAAAAEAELSGRPDYGYRLSGGLPLRAASFVLERAQAAGRSVSLVALVDERRWIDAEPRDVRRTLPVVSLNGQRMVRVGAGHAAAALAAAAMPPGPGTILVIDGASADAGAIFRKHDSGHIAVDTPIRGAGQLVHAARLVARALGLAEDSAIEALAELGNVDAQEWGGAFDKALRPDANGYGGILLDESALRAAIDRAGADSPGALTTIDHPHREVQRRRRALAAALVDRQIELVQGLASAATSGAGDTAGAGTPIGFAGSFFVSPRINTRLAASLNAAAVGSTGRSVTVSPVPESVGLALGAALAIWSGSPAVRPQLRSLGLGPAFGEDAIKETLENCRIDYVYEPDWPRLTGRASQLLGRGKVVAWFHGALDFGPRSLGGRSILCDPSNRYARHNINEYLLHRPVDAPLAVSIPTESAADSLDTPLASPFMLLRGQFREDHAASFQAALDASRACAIHTVDRTLAPELHDLLTTHAANTGVPGLIHVPLQTHTTPTAATPRDAIGSLFTSAIDAIVISRFLVMKDYWLLRTAS
jgi:carbamoyltransferase